jgi:hypothetical protein
MVDDFTGGGYSGGGKLMFDSEGNAWVGDNFLVGAQNQDALWDGNTYRVRTQRQAAVTNHHGLYWWWTRRHRFWTGH